ncbi:MAG: serine/threonine-protein phosphatase [Bacteroidetes bacterium]|nr:serine/threonine-protein phosphatase [Bacteroidota bacterium]
MKTIISYKQPIGISDIQSPFHSHKIQLISGDSVNLFTEGYADQFGGEKGMKFKYRQLKELLLANAHLSMQQQKNVLIAQLNPGSKLEQVDDILIIGIRV